MTSDITKVKILGAEYKISCPPEESFAVKDAADYLDDKLKEIKKTGINENSAAIIVALNITNDYLKLIKDTSSNEAQEDKINQLTEDIKKHLDSLSL
tara:strand:- start:30594 stop:30884 length:291 start_codon:yes stop_codon:yes gene_type:complete